MFLHPFYCYLINLKKKLKSLLNVHVLYKLEMKGEISLAITK